MDIIDLVLNFYIYSRRGGRAASKAAQQKISSDVADMSNLNKKKRRPSTPKAKETRYEIFVRAQEGRGHWSVYYSGPKNFKIMFSYSLAHQVCGLK